MRDLTVVAETGEVHGKGGEEACFSYFLSIAEALGHRRIVALANSHSRLREGIEDVMVDS